MVLPPTVLGFYLLIALGPSGPGGWIAGLWGDRTLAFMRSVRKSGAYDDVSLNSMRSA